jgi:hypothetical protein
MMPRILIVEDHEDVPRGRMHFIAELPAAQ